MCEVCREVFKQRDAARVQFLGEVFQGGGTYLTFSYDTKGKVILMGSYDALEEEEKMFNQENSFGLHAVVSEKSSLILESLEQARKIYGKIKKEAEEVWNGKMRPENVSFSYLKSKYCF